MPLEFLKKLRFTCTDDLAQLTWKYESLESLEECLAPPMAGSILILFHFYASAPTPS